MNHRWIWCIAAGLLIVLAGRAGAGETPVGLAYVPTKDKLAFTLRPYLWAPTIKGDVGISADPIGDITVPVDESVLDYADQLQGALLLYGEARKGR